MGGLVIVFYYAFISVKYSQGNQYLSFLRLKLKYYHRLFKNNFNYQTTFFVKKSRWWNKAEVAIILLHKIYTEKKTS